MQGLGRVDSWVQIPGGVGRRMKGQRGVDKWMQSDDKVDSRRHCSG